MSWRTDKATRREYYARTVKATINRRDLSFEQHVEPPADVERREFPGPCLLCGERGKCRHRTPESQARGQVSWIKPIPA